MLIQELEYCEAIASTHLITAGDRPDDTFSLVFSNGKLSLLKGNKVLYEEESVLPKKIVVSLDGVPSLSSRATTAVSNGVARGLLTIFTQPADLEESGSTGLNWLNLFAP